MRANIRYHFLIILLLFSVLVISYLPEQIFWWNSSKTPLESSSVSNDVFDFPPLDSDHVRTMCSLTNWNPHIIFTCDNSFGGVGNVRNSILNCVRYAISAGASLVVPRIIVRDAEDISRPRTSNKTDMDYMFDIPHFIESLRLSCPQMTVYRYLDDLVNLESASGPVALLPESLVSGEIPNVGLEDPWAWKQLFEEWMDDIFLFDNRASWSRPVVIELGRSFLQYPIYRDGGDLMALSLGGIIKFRQDVRILATKALENMMSTYNLSRNISQPILNDAFFGAHLRTELDAIKAWPADKWVDQPYEVQSEHILRKLAETNLALIYVASGNNTEIARFSQDAAAYNLTSKFMLLEGKDRQYLNTLTWDQQALVDFLVMMKSSFFVGIGHSSFTWNIALKRHTLLPGSMGELDEQDNWSDQFSMVYGAPNMYNEHGNCLWP